MNLEKNKDITSLSKFATPAKAEYYFEIKSEDDIEELKNITSFAKDNNLPFLFVGTGTNMLFAFECYKGIIIKNNLSWWNYDTRTHILHSYSHELISEIAKQLENDYKQDIWHRFIGLPWSVWWAVFWNAGCFWLETENNFLEAQVFDLESGQLSILSKTDMKFSYRSSILKQKEGKYFLISARFDLSKIREKYSSDVDNIYFREHKQPKWNTCGSFFKNPSREKTAWYLIEQVWLKWYKIWGAFFSDLHANFLMNDGGSYKDLLELINIAQKKVKEQFGIDLVNEVRIIRNEKEWIKK